jgi:selenium metabolism protein YedF
MIQVNSMGDACPLPVVKTKNALENLTSANVIETLVDNDVAVQNLLRFAKNRGLNAEQKTLGESAFAVVIDVPASFFEGSDAESDKEVPEEYLSCVPLVDENKSKKIAVVISSDRMGSGDDALGETLMKSFIYALTQQDRLPGLIITYNGGVKLACEGSPALEDLKDLKSRGVTIFSCGTCLSFYNLTDKLGVGEATNMYEIVAMMLEADRIVKP